MIGVAANRHAVGATEFRHRSTDDQLKPSIISQNSKAICAARLDLGEAENRNKKIPSRSNVGNVKI